MTHGLHRALGLLAVAAVAALAGGCGSDSASTGNAKPPPGVSKSRFPALLADAAKVTKADFPPAGGHTLSQLAATAKGQAQIGLATSVIEPGANRLAFGVIDNSNNFLYGRTAVYLARTQSSPARGPYPAPADTLVTTPAYRSQSAASESDPIAAIYAAQVDFKKAGKQIMLVLTKTPQGTQGGLVPIKVVKDSGLPHVGEKMPPVDTETVADAGGNEASIDTRIPPAPELHQHRLKDVLGKKPVAFLIATPLLCQSRVCGPVVDIALQMKAEFGDRMEFIHQEVYKDNEVAKGLRAPLLQLHLETEPWLFTIKRDGTIAARIEGSFGVAAFRRAVKAALR
ncbi:MAG: hypothetical protein QOE11_2319 [Solirubrobacteraceae bacterium]|jgi:hypothetical protein|nr:hypothetical protein [Solirubrobacteraceae bacterium]